MRYESLIGTGLSRWNSPLLPSQRQIWDDLDTPNILFSGAYRAGKSEVCCRLAIRHALVHERARVGIFRNYLKSIKQSTLITLLQLIDPNLLADWSNSELVATLVNGSRISFFGCDDPDRIGSVELSFAFIDEVHEITEESYTMIRGRLSLNPTVWYPYRGSPFSAKVRQLICAANPKAKNHHLYQRFWGDREGHKVYFGNTLENRYLPDDYVRNLISSYTRPGVTLDEVYEKIGSPQLADLFNSQGRRNLLGIWGSSDQQWYPDFEKAIVTSMPEPEFTIAGIDWGYNHPRFCKLGLADGKWYVFGYWAPSKLTPDDFIEGVARRLEGVEYCYVPPDQPGLIRQLKRQASGVRRAKNSVLPGISAIASAMGKSLFFVADGSKDWLICHDEFNGYERKVDSKTGEVTDVPNKINDHFCLLPGTQILTPKGEVAIESLKLGDRVITRNGVQPVELVALTERKPIYKIYTKTTYLLASGDHPVYSVDKAEFIPARNVKPGDNLCLIERSWFTTEIKPFTAATIAKLLTSERVEKVELLKESHCIEIGVSNDHEYFANGLLVGNCDAVRYAFYTHIRRNRESDDDDS